MVTTSSNPPVLLTVQQCSERLNIPRSATYLLIMSKQLSSIKIGRLRRVPMQALEDFVRERLSEQVGRDECETTRV